MHSLALNQTATKGLPPSLSHYVHYIYKQPAQLTIIRYDKFELDTAASGRRPRRFGIGGGS